MTNAAKRSEADAVSGCVEAGDGGATVGGRWRARILLGRHADAMFERRVTGRSEAGPGGALLRSYTPAVTAVSLREVTDENRDAVLALRVAPGQERFVGTVAGALADAEEIPEGRPWYRAIYAGDQPVGFLMLSWNVTPDPPRIIGPWFLWKLLIDRRQQGRGYGSAAVRRVADLVRAEGAAELLTSCVPAEDGPEAFYRRIGFRRTGTLDENGEIILALEVDR